ncbi:hypothetical protein, partial [Azospirillum sp. TSO22-1]|uniref:hypothetical protein n=1 Tax=Azospirillum sp. TSO22-1 TaxID=716789 RepID=UPI0018EEB464
MRTSMTVLCLEPTGSGQRYGALPHRGRDGWYVLDHRTNRVAVIDDRPQTGLPARVAGALAAMLNAAAAKAPR